MLLGFTEVRVGVIPAIISVVCLPKMRRGDALEAFLRGRRFPATEAAELGLINRAVPAAELDAAVAEVVDDLKQGGPIALGQAKRLVYEIPALTAEEAYRITAARSAELFAQRGGGRGHGSLPGEAAPVVGARGGMTMAIDVHERGGRPRRRAGTRSTPSWPRSPTTSGSCPRRQSRLDDRRPDRPPHLLRRRRRHRHRGDPTSSRPCATTLYTAALDQPGAADDLTLGSYRAMAPPELLDGVAGRPRAGSAPRPPRSPTACGSSGTARR